MPGEDVVSAITARTERAGKKPTDVAREIAQAVRERAAHVSARWRSTR